MAGFQPFTPSVDGYIRKLINTYPTIRSDVNYNSVSSGPSRVSFFLSTSGGSMDAPIITSSPPYDKNRIVGGDTIYTIAEQPIYDENGVATKYRLRWLLNKSTPSGTHDQSTMAWGMDVYDIEEHETVKTLLPMYGAIAPDAEKWTKMTGFYWYYGPSKDTSDYQVAIYFRLKADGIPPASYGVVASVAWLNSSAGLGNYGHFDPSKVITDPNEQDPDGPSKPGGGEGDFDPIDDIIPIPPVGPINEINAVNAGFVTLYKATMADLNAIADEVYSTSVWNAIRNWLDKPSDMIAGLMLLPVTPVSGAMYFPHIGDHLFTRAMPIVANQYITVDMGNIDVAEYYGSCFDYSPFSKCQIFLPFIGVRELDIDEIMSKTIHLEYHIDCYNGDCIAFITVGDHSQNTHGIRYQFAGNCGQQVPVSGNDFSAIIDNSIKFATMATASVITAGAAGAAATEGAAMAAAHGAVSEAEAGYISQAAISTANSRAALDIGASAISTVMNAKPRVERAGSIGSASGFMGCLRPFLIRTTPRQSLPQNYSHYNGYPSNITATLNTLEGYTIIDQINLRNVPATDNELAEIESLLKGGVYL